MIPEEEIRSIIAEVDYMGNKKINYSEFIAATLNVKSIMSHEKMNAIFK